MNAIVFILLIDSLTAKSVPVGEKLVLFGGYVQDFYEGIVQQVLSEKKLGMPKITHKRRIFD